MKSLHFLGTVLKDLREFPDDIKREVGFDLRRVQSGLEPRDWKPMTAVGAGVRELRIKVAAGHYRVFYVVEKGDAVFVLHAFNKKTRKTPQAAIDLGRARFKLIE